MIHNHEVGGSGPPLATENQEVTKIQFVTSFYLHTICTQKLRFQNQYKSSWKLPLR
jgi:hypothetical protein